MLNTSPWRQKHEKDCKVEDNGIICIAFVRGALKNLWFSAKLFVCGAQHEHRTRDHAMPWRAYSFPTVKGTNSSTRTGVSSHAGLLQNYELSNNSVMTF